MTEIGAVGMNKKKQFGTGLQTALLEVLEVLYDNPLERVTQLWDQIQWKQKKNSKYSYLCCICTHIMLLFSLYKSEET